MHDDYNPPAVNYAAVRTFNRVWAPRARLHTLAAYADAQFDGGEWSAGQHAIMEQDEEGVVLQKVAVRFGLTAEQLEQMVYMSICYENDRFMMAIFERGYL